VVLVAVGESYGCSWGLGGGWDEILVEVGASAVCDMVTALYV